MFKKVLGLLTVSSMILLVFAGVGYGGEATAAEKITLRLIHYAGGGQDFWENLIKSFMKENPNIVVEQEVVQPGQYHQKLGGYVTVGEGPDLLLMEAGLSTIKYKDVLLDLKGKFNEIIGSVTGVEIYYNDFDPAKELLAFPTASNGHMVYYNKLVFKEAGLDPENPPKTWREMDEAVKAIKAVGKEGIALGAREYGVLWLWSALGSCTMSQEDLIGMYRGTTKWTERPLKDVIVLLEDMYKRGWFIPNAASATVSPEAQDMFINGEAAFFVSLLGDAFNWKIWGDSMGYENFGVMKLPVIEKDFPLEGVSPGPASGTIPFWGSYAFGIAKWSRNPGAAVDFLKYCLRPDVQERFVLEGGFFPNALLAFDIAKVKAPQFATLVEWARESKIGVAPLYNYPEEWDAFMRNTQLLLTDQINADKFAAEMQRVHEEVASKH